MKPHRVLALASRHVYLYGHSPFRLLEMVYWPLLDLVLWGFVSIWLRDQAGGAAVPHVLAFFLGGLILWDLLFRAQQGVSLAYLEEVWSRNLMNLFVSPLTVNEFLASTVLVSGAKLLVSGTLITAFAWGLYGFNLLALGPPLAAFLALLVLFGWALGTVTTAIVMRYGQGAESLAWVLAFMIQPIACVFYPLATLPAWLVPLALATPAAHVFEGMRDVIAGRPFPLGHLAAASALDVLYVVASVAFFHHTFALVRERGLLARTGE